MRIQEFLWIVCFLLMSLFVHGIPVDTMELKIGDRCPAFTFEDRRDSPDLWMNLKGN